MKLLLLSLFCGLAALAAAAEGPRLAILADPATVVEADLLTAELSSQPVQLLERVEIERVLAEQKLALTGLTSADLGRLGQLLKADGLLLLGMEGKEKQRTLVLRCVAVHPGVIIESSREEAPADPAKWSRETGARLASLLPKLAVTAEAALPVSILNLRVTRARPEAAELERELTVLLTHRLAHEPALFVLERQQMALLEKEKPDADAPFWTGRWLIDGSIEQALSDPEALTITARLHPPGGGAASVIKHECRRGELLAAAGTLSDGIARALKQQPGGQAWDATLEAEQFWREGQWAMRNGLYAPAERAAEASWALGRRQAETMALRVQSILLAAHPEEVLSIPFPAEAVKNYFYTRLQLWSYEIAKNGRPRTPLAMRGAFQKMPAPEREERLRNTLRGVAMARDHATLLQRDPALFQLALVTGGALLDWLADNRAGVYDDSMQALQEALRELVAQGPAGPLVIEDDINWQELQVSFAPVLARSPAETIAVFRQALGRRIDTNRDGQIRLALAHTRDLRPALVAERRAESPAALRLWKELLDELAASDFVGDRLFSLYGLAALQVPPGQEPPMKNVFEGFWKERALWAKDELAYDYLKLLNIPRGTYVNTGLLLPPPKRDPEDKIAFAQRFLVYFMDEKPFVGEYLFRELYHPDLYTEGEALEVYLAFLRFEGRFRAKFGDRDSLRIARERSQELLLRFPKLILPTEKPSLTVTHFWHPWRTQGIDSGFTHAFPDVNTAFYSKGRLWFHCSFEQAAGGKKPYDERPYFVFAVDLQTFATETILCPGNPAPLEPRRPWLENSKHALVTPEAVFITHANQLSRYDRRAHTWSFYPQLLNVFAQPTLIGERLYLRSDNSRRPDGGRLLGELTEVNVTTGALTLIASDRRQPPESPLDTWPYGELTVQAAPPDRIYFRNVPLEGTIGTRFAAYDPAARQWSPLDEKQWSKVAPPQPDEWKILPRLTGPGYLSLARGKVKFTFSCELSAEDRQLLLANGPLPPAAAIERLMPGNGVVPYYRTVPEGLIIFGASWSPGFWFVPKAELDAAEKEFAPKEAAKPPEKAAAKPAAKPAEKAAASPAEKAVAAP